MLRFIFIDIIARSNFARQFVSCSRTVGKRLGAIGDDHFAAFCFVVPARGARLSTTVVPRSRQEGGASCRLLALIVSRQVARADACRAVPPASLRPTSAALPRSLLPYSPASSFPFPSLLNSPGPSAVLPPNRATNRRLRIGVSCARFDLLRRP